MECKSYLDTVNKRDGELFEKNMDSAMVEFLENEINKPEEQFYTKKQLARDYENRMKQTSRQRFANVCSKRKR